MVRGCRGEPAAREGLGGSSAKLEGGSPTEKGSPTRPSTAVLLAAAVFDTGGKTRGAVFADKCPFQALGKGSRQKQSGKKIFY